MYVRGRLQYFRVKVQKGPRARVRKPQVLRPAREFVASVRGIRIALQSGCHQVEILLACPSTCR